MTIILICEPSLRLLRFKICDLYKICKYGENLETVFRSNYISTNVKMQKFDFSQVNIIFSNFFIKQTQFEIKFYIRKVGFQIDFCSFKSNIQYQPTLLASCQLSGQVLKSCSSALSLSLLSVIFSSHSDSQRRSSRSGNLQLQLCFTEEELKIWQSDSLPSSL